MTTATTKWEDLTPRERDALAAEHVMGWPHSDSPAELGAAIMGKADVYWARDDHDEVIVARPSKAGPWSPSTDPGADYEVLDRVRETWDRVRQYRMISALLEIWRERGPSHVMPSLRYQPGDYSRAALVVLAVVE